MIKDVIDDIQLLMPAWKQYVAKEIKRQPDLLRKTNDVKSKTSTTLDQWEKAEAAIKSNGKLIEDFYAK